MRLIGELCNGETDKQGERFSLECLQIIAKDTWSRRHGFVSLGGDALEDIGARVRAQVRARMEEQNMTPEQMAAQCRWPVRKVNLMMLGRHQLTLRDLVDVGIALGLNWHFAVTPKETP